MGNGYEVRFSLEDGNYTGKCVVSSSRALAWSANSASCPFRVCFQSDLQTVHKVVLKPCPAADLCRQSKATAVVDTAVEVNEVTSTTTEVVTKCTHVQ